MESVVDDVFPADADAALLWELLGALPTDDQNQADAHSSVKLVRSSEDPQLPEIGGEEAEALRGDVGLLEALCTPLVAFDDGFLADDLDVHEVLRLEDRGDKMPVVEESASSTGTPSDDQPPSRARRKRTATKQGPKRYNSNKAREEQRRELLSLRSQVTEMEKAIEVMRVAAARGQSTLQTLVSRRDKLALAQLAQPSSGRDTCERHVELTNVWRQMCLQQLTRRIKAQQENAMLKDAVARRAQVTTGIQMLLQTPLDPNGAADVTTHKRSRVPKIPSVDPEVEREIFARLSSGVDAAFGDIDAFLEDKGLLNVDTPRHGTQVREAGGGIVLDVFVTSVLPFDWEVASSGVWQFYKGFKRHFGPVHDKMTQRIDAGEDTVMESFIIEITANNVTADFRVRQVMKRFVQEQQLMLVCQNDCQPIEYMNQTTNFGFRETSFVICRPPRAPQEADKARKPVSILQLGQWISPYMVTTHKASQQVSLHANIDDISQFLFSSLHVEMRAKINRIEDLLMDEHRSD